MGLSVAVGTTADDDYAELRTQLDALSAALAAKGITWHDPGPVEEPYSRGFPYSWLHTLRRVLALVNTGAPVPPLPPAEAAGADKDVVEDETMMFTSHLLSHSDCEGYYVPVAFPHTAYVDEATVAGGGMVGSSQGLLTELRRCAPALGVSLGTDGALPDPERHRLRNLPRGADFAVETEVWLTLHDACEASIRTGCAIVFC